MRGDEPSAMRPFHRSGRAATTVLALLSSLAIAPAAATEPGLRATVTHVGLLELVGPVHSRPDRGSVTGRANTAAARFVTETDRVPLVRGTTFGFEMVVQGAPDDRPTRFKQVYRHPPMRKEGGPEVTRQVTFWEATGAGGTIIVQPTYSFEEEYELVPGEWTISVFHDEQLLAERRFVVGTVDGTIRSGEPDRPPKFR